MISASISIDASCRYPLTGQYSPRVFYPEYPFDRNSKQGDNDAYTLIRRCLSEFGCDPARLGTPQWNPLGKWIRPGADVFVLPNFVMHRRPNETRDNFYSKCTQSAVLRPVMDYAIIASGNSGRLTFGNAPIQACDYAEVSRDTGAAQLAEFYRLQARGDVGPYDLRMNVSRWTRFGALLEVREQNSDECVSVDLGSTSWLEALYKNSLGPVQVRVGDYNPQEILSYHGPGKHVYVINRRVLEADVIISVPKLKTHQKVGLTCGLKGTVGAIARKQCLAHYRKGGPGSFGDEYPWDTPWHHFVSHLIDAAAQHGTGIQANVLRVTSKLLARVLRIAPHGIMGGGWYGNDTAWRMALDIARILRYARQDGTLSATPQREHLAFVDGIVAGEGDGPLRPRSRHLGAVVFAPDVCAADVACALLAGYDPLRIPLVRQSFDQGAFPLSAATWADLVFAIDGRATPLAEVGPRVRPKKWTGLEPPKGWKGRIERNGSCANTL